ncbi:MAG: flagellar basal body rod protein [Pseudomonadales bacterium]|nr:flagellar basal body rod protein [Pseudomonadales bacterium]
MVMKVVCWVLVLGMSLAASAEEGGGGSAVPYVDLSPSFVTNFGGSGAGDTPHYVKVDVSLRVASNDIADEVKYHAPSLRNYLLLLFTAQNQQTMTTPQGQEFLRQQALKGINAILLREDGSKVQVQNVFFTSFVVQQ